jgi:NAD-dependent deacetylase|tara:strand:+ start:12311 stop:13039 length:729 start_codon:yes stop_codon:yes gene_type:complete
MCAKELQKTSAKKLKLVVLSGAGISAESGINTFRGAGGLWEGYDVRDVATPQAWERDKELVLRFYNERRRDIAAVEPNVAHRILAELQEEYEVKIITQNIDNLHEKAGSQDVLHLHGEITKAFSSVGHKHLHDIGFEDINLGDKCPNGHQIRPFIVWFGEDVPLIPAAVEQVSTADVVLVIGTSLEVYPAAGLVTIANPHVPIYVIDPNDITHKIDVPNKVIHIQKGGSEGMQEFRAIIGEV